MPLEDHDRHAIEHIRRSAQGGNQAAMLPYAILLLASVLDRAVAIAEHESKRSDERDAERHKQRD